MREALKIEHTLVVLVAESVVAGILLSLVIVGLI